MRVSRVGSVVNYLPWLRLELSPHAVCIQVDCSGFSRKGDWDEDDGEQEEEDEEGKDTEMEDFAPRGTRGFNGTSSALCSFLSLPPSSPHIPPPSSRSSFRSSRSRCSSSPWGEYVINDYNVAATSLRPISVLRTRCCALIYLQELLY